jgi:iron-sulfur cluster assembly protein
LANWIIIRIFIDMITVTESAAKKVQSLIEESGFKTPYLRVSVKGGGCSGLSYDLSFDTDQQPNDTLAEDKGVKILVDNKSLLYLFGTELEFSDGLNGKGFQFINPNASRTCGCGESFAV